MSIQFVFGGSGAGKSTYVYKQMLDMAERYPQKQFFVMVPDQFTMSTQKKLCQMSKSGGIMNIDVQSFSRLVYRIAEEVGAKQQVLLDDTGKNLILRNIALQIEDELQILKQKLRRPGFIHEVKSMISEFYQYAISPQDLDVMIEQAKGKGTLPYKLSDIKLLYESFSKEIKEGYVTSEQSVLQLCDLIKKSNLLKDSVIVFDGFTGFTPLQCLVVQQLLLVAEQVTVTLCADSREDILYVGEEQKLFALSAQTYSKLGRFADQEQIQILDPVFLKEKPVMRHKNNKELAFLEAQLFRYSGKVYDASVEAIHIHEAQTITNELQNVCKQIKAFIREEKMCYRDIAVVTGDLRRYAHIVEREFARYDIPYFMDQNRGVLYHPMTEYLKKSLEIVKSNFSYNSVMSFLKSGMSDLSIDEIDKLSVYLKKKGIRGKRAYESSFVKDLQKEDALEMEAEEIRKKLMKEIIPVLSEMSTAKEYVLALYKLCENAALQKKCQSFAEEFERQNDLSRAKEYEKIYEQCMRLFDQVYALLGDQKVSCDEFLEIFEAGISEIQIGTIPQDVDQVVVGDIERSRLSEVKVLFFIGVNDGVIPGKGSAGGFLSTMEREFLISQGRELAPSNRQLIFQQRLYLYQNMTKPTDHLFISYVKMTGDGKQAMPSYLIRVVKSMYSKIKVTNDEELEKKGILHTIETMTDGLDDFAKLMRTYVADETVAHSQQEKELLDQLIVLTKAYTHIPVYTQLLQAAVLAYMPKKLQRDIAKRLYEDKNKGSISRLETFAACAYAQFLKYGLGIKESGEFTFTNIDLGNIYHDVLHQIFQSVALENRTLADFTQQELDEQVEILIKQIESSYESDIFIANERNKYRLVQMERVLKRSLTTLQYQLKKGNFEPVCFEQNFSIAGEQTLIGKVDRVDTFSNGAQTYVSVVDYKSSDRSFDESDFYYGLSLQLPLYLYAMQQQLKKRFPKQEIIPAAMLYFGLKNPILSEEDMKVGEDASVLLSHSMRMDGLVLEDDVVLENLDKEFEQESDVIKVKKKKDGTFTAASQVITKEDMNLSLQYAKYKADSLMQAIKEGDIAVNPFTVEGSQKDSCTYCPYRQVCHFDYQIPGYEMNEVPKMKGDMRKEAMRHAIDGGSAESSTDKK